MLKCAFILAILVTGGVEDGEIEDSTSVEVLLSNGSSLCSLPDMPGRMYHTQSGLTACGEAGGIEAKGCIQFQSGSWTSLTQNLSYDRYYHTSWVNVNTGDIHLIGGGGDSGDTTEIVSQDGTSRRSFDTKYTTR